MIRLLPLLAVLAAVPAAAQIAPTPSFEDPRLQTVSFEPGQAIRLVVFPDSSLKLVFHRGELIERVVVSDGAAFRAAVVGADDTIEIAPLRAGAVADLRVSTSQRQYLFSLHTGSALSAAYVVRLVDAAAEQGQQREQVAASNPDPGAPLVGYRVKGDRALRPDSIVDDGMRTFIDWHRDKALPAVFGLGPGGEEEIVAGYMRDDTFVIDRIYPELVFRFDKRRATARREPERTR